MALWLHSTSILLVVTVLGTCTGHLAHRLKKNFRPVNYKIDLTINSFEDTTYQGEVDIRFRANGSDTELWINASPSYISNITEWKISDQSGYLSCTKGGWDKTTEILHFMCQFEQGMEYMLHVEYEAKFSEGEMEGFYKSTYVDDNVTSTMLATQFEPIYARRTFPSFDEPEFKATFDISVTHPANYTALSNMPANHTSAKDGGLIQTTFSTSPVMSTYVVAIIISNFEYAVPSVPSTKFDYRVYARKSANNDMTIAKEYGTRLLETMGAWIGIPYETLGDKQAYQVAIPDFSAGAMENMGLITYREAALLDEGEKTSNAEKQKLVTVIAHELSHQWFGDYATMDWWSNLWLNEGFATYFESHIPSKILGFDEDFELEKQFISVVQLALKTDADKTAIALSGNMSAINTLVEINQRFDDITYLKGGSIVRMMSNIIGLENFRTALKDYLNDRHEINKNPENLLGHLQRMVPTIPNFSDHMHDWIYNPGFPLLKATYLDNKIILTQERFNSENSGDTWSIPISYASADKPDFDFKLLTWMRNLTTIEHQPDSWIIFNVQAIGFYRVNYDAYLWDRIIEALNGQDFDKIDVLNRAQLIDDIYNIAKIGKVSYDQAFQLSNYLKEEKEFYPWLSAFTAFEFLLRKLDHQTKESLKSLILGYINQAFDQKDEKDFEGHVGKIKEALIKTWSCKLGQQECKHFAKMEFDSYKKNSSLIDRNFRSTILCYGLKHSQNISHDYNLLFDNFKKSDSSIEQTSILVALGCMNDQDILQNYLYETVRENSHIRRQDAATVFATVYTNSEKGMDSALHFLDKYFAKVETAYKGLNSISRIIIGLAEEISTDEQRKLLTDIIDQHRDNEEVMSVRKRALEAMEENRRWSDRYQGSIQMAINSLSGSPTMTLQLGLLLLGLLNIIA